MHDSAEHHNRNYGNLGNRRNKCDHVYLFTPVQRFGSRKATDSTGWFSPTCPAEGKVKDKRRVSAKHRSQARHREVTGCRGNMGLSKANY